MEKSRAGIIIALVAMILAAGTLFFLLRSGEEPPPPPEPAKPEAPKKPQVRMNGELTDVYWSDGDTFKLQSGPHAGSGVRLVGFNTLESYGPVHRWGSWTAKELYAIAASSKEIGEAGTWSCTSELAKDKYKRILANCPDIAAAMISKGHAHAFFFDEGANEDLLKLQREAQEAKRGIWAKGVPDAIITSLHSESEGKGKGYARAASTKTGFTEKRPHGRELKVCEEVCLEDEGGPTCMVHVPYKIRYHDKPPCLQGD